MAVEDPQLHAYYCPALGPAPRWASYLENLVGDDPATGVGGGNAPTTYDNYKFVTREQLIDLGLSHLIGKSSVLRAYMHGFFLDVRLWEKARAIAQPFALDEWRAEQATRRFEAERASRIRVGTGKQAGKAVASDARFARLADDPDFAVERVAHQAASVLRDKQQRGKTKK